MLTIEILKSWLISLISTIKLLFKILTMKDKGFSYIQKACEAMDDIIDALE